MASTLELPGLLSADKKKAFALQLGGLTGQPTDGVNEQSVTSGLVANPFGTNNAAVTSNANTGTPVNETIKDFAFNPKYASMDQEYRRKISNAGLQRTSQKAEISDTYSRAVEDADRVKTDALQRLQERMASQGLSQSGINLQENTKTTNEFQRYLDNLSNQKAKAEAGVEGDYGSMLADIAAAREQMYMQQVQEEEAARLQQEEEARQAQRAQEEADRQAQLLQELIAAQQAAQASYVAPSIPQISIPGIGVSVPDSGVGAVSAVPAQGNGNYQNLQGLNVNTIMKSGNQQVLKSYVDNPNLPDVIRQAASTRLRQLGGAASVGTSAATAIANLFKKK